MNMRALIALGCTAAACIACPEPALPAVDDPVDIDVVVSGDSAEIYVRPQLRSCRCSEEPLLEEGCGQLFTDNFDCACGEVAISSPREVLGCVRELRIGDRAADVLADSFRHGSFTLPVVADEELVISGCGADVRIDVRSAAAPEARGATDLQRLEPLLADAAVAVEGASLARICSDWFFAADCCVSEAGSRVFVPVNLRGCSPSVSLDAIAGPVTTQSHAGTIRVWSRASVRLADSLSVPEPLDGEPDERFVAVCRDQPISLDTEGALFADRVVFALGDASFTLTDESGAFEVVLGVDEDVVRLFEAERTYVGVNAHDARARALPLGTFDELTLDEDPADVTLVNVDDPSDVRTMTLAITGSLPAIARP